MDLLSDILLHLRLKGTLYFRTSFSSPWSIGVPAYKEVARFHFAHKGRCVVRVEGVEKPIVLEKGDLIIITRGAEHTLYSDHEHEQPVTELDHVIESSGFDGTGALVYGEFNADQETQLICGHFAFEDQARHPIINALPASIHLKNYGEAAGIWLENSLRVIGAEAGNHHLGSDLIAMKMSEIIFTQALRSYLENEGQNNTALSGYTDTRIAKTLNAIHHAPSHNWTLDELAALAGMSRTSFSTTFTDAMTMSPVTYMTQWRMEVARQKLVDSNDPLIAVAEGVGYQSEASFSRVFKKHSGFSPAAFRKTHRDLAQAEQ